MKKIVLIISLAIGCVSSSFSQTGEHENGGRFLKRIEDNYANRNTAMKAGKVCGHWNLDSKTEVEKLFFGDCNAMVEFFYAPPFDGASGFRIVRDSADTSFLLEVKRISNYKEAEQKASEKYPSIGVPAEIFLSMPEDIMTLISKHNVDAIPKREKEKFDLYKVETLSFQISDRFAEKLYAKTVSAIDNFKVKGKPGGILDGYRVIFRVVVGDEVWTLNIHEPRGNALAFSDLFRLIITDSQEGKFDDTKYIKLLKN